MKKILIDTDVLINYTNGYSKELEGLLQDQRNNKAQLFINPVIIGEFCNDKNLSDKQKASQTIEFLNLFTVVNVTKETGILAGELLRKEKIPFLADAFITATCVQFNLQLYTNNKKDFKKVKKLKLFTL